MVFLHGHRYAYHQEDVLTLLDAIEDPSTLPGYCNLNCGLGPEGGPCLSSRSTKSNAALRSGSGPCLRCY